MLVFSRKVGEGIVLPGCGVTVTVTRVAGKRVRLSILAPPEMLVHRTEVLRRIQCEDDRTEDADPATTEEHPGDGLSSVRRLSLETISS
ncbi:MAG: carbon storage regulator [Rhodopirellula sp.]|nr:carbon storage regulator [Rhodopirellula sp.]